MQFPLFNRLLPPRKVRPRVGIVCSITTRTVRRDRSSLHVRTIIISNIHHVPLTPRRVAQFVSRVEDDLGQHGRSRLCPALTPCGQPRRPLTTATRRERIARIAPRPVALILLVEQRARNLTYSAASALPSYTCRDATLLDRFEPATSLANRNAGPQYDTTSTICSRERKPPPRRS